MKVSSRCLAGTWTHSKSAPCGRGGCRLRVKSRTWHNTFTLLASSTSSTTPPTPLQPSSSRLRPPRLGPCQVEGHWHSQAGRQAARARESPQIIQRDFLFNCLNEAILTLPVQSKTRRNNLSNKIRMTGTLPTHFRIYPEDVAMLSTSMRYILRSASLPTSPGPYNFYFLYFLWEPARSVSLSRPSSMALDSQNRVCLLSPGGQLCHR